ANVYKGETYMRSFMDDLEKQGIASGSFSHNGLNYVYLERYDDLKEARRNYISDIKDKYHGDVWVLNIDNDNQEPHSGSNTAYASNSNSKNSAPSKQEVESRNDNQQLIAKVKKEKVLTNYNEKNAIDSH